MRCLTTGLAAAGLAQGCSDPTEAGPGPTSGEVRAVWLALFSPKDLFCEDGQPRGIPTVAGVERVLGIIAASGFNTLFLQVDSYYAYSLLHPEYQPGNPLAAFDALAHIERVAHAHGLWLHLNYPLVNNRNNPPPPTGVAPDFLPECGGSPEWQAQFIDDGGIVTASPSNVCPSRPATRAWELDLLAGLVQRYPRITSFQLEEPGFDRESFCVCEECRTEFAARHGGDLVAEAHLERTLDSCPDPACAGHAATFKCEQLTALQEELRARLRSCGFLYSATISYNRWHDRRLGRDWPAWTRRGWWRFAAPMIYVFDSATFRAALEEGVLAHIAPGCSVRPGIGLHFGGSLDPTQQRPPDLNPVSEVLRQIATAREVARMTGRVSGMALFLGEYLRPQFRDTGIAMLAEIGAAAFPTPAPCLGGLKFRAHGPFSVVFCVREPQLILKPHDDHCRRPDQSAPARGGWPGDEP